LDLLALLKFAVAAGRDGTVVNEDVGAGVILLNESISLVGVEPFDGAGWHWVPLHGRRWQDVLMACGLVAAIRPRLAAPLTARTRLDPERVTGPATSPSCPSCARMVK